MRGSSLIVPALCAALLAPPAAAAEARGAVAFVERRIAPEVADRRGWARDVVAALRAAGRPVDVRSVCATLAVVDLTSGFATSVRLDRWGRYSFAAALERQLGARGAAWARRLLALRDPASGRSWHDRFAGARDEAELDRAFRDALATARSRAPLALAAIEGVARWSHDVRLDELNPIRTAGPMQVSVIWAAGATGTPPDRLDELRDRLFSRAGGLRLGVARLFAVADRYDRPGFVFADFNAGPYASRNAAFQAALVELTGGELVLDGDLMRYDAAGRPVGRSRTLAELDRFAAAGAHGLDAATIRRDVAVEKSAELEGTATWRAVRAAWRARHGAEPAFARMPEIRVRNPKTGAPSQLASFVGMAEGRFRRCLAGRPLGVERRRAG